MRLKGRVAIVTGAQRGIGKAIALALAGEGALVVVSDVDLEGCEKVASEIIGLGSVGIAFKCDISKEANVRSMVDVTLAKFKRIDILVNNAGIAAGAPLVDLDEKTWDAVLGVNLKGVYLCSRAVAKQMISQRSGRIISLSSIAGLRGFAGASAYCASKAGISNFTRALALELAPHNITVNAIAPGIIQTAMTRDILADKDTNAAMLAQTPLGRFGEPDDIAKVAVFLVSDDASFITGQTIAVDGGWTAK